MAEKQSFMRVDEVAQELGVSKSYAYKIVQKLNAELKSLGYLTISGRVNRKFFYEKLCYGEKEGRGMMYGVNDTPNLHFATAAGKIGNGLDEQLENFMREHPDTNLIIIDTMQKIREVGGEAYSYASDYEIVGKLKQLADKHCI